MYGVVKHTYLSRPELGEECAGSRSRMSVAGAGVGEEQHRPEVREEDAVALGQIHLVPRS